MSKPPVIGNKFLHNIFQDAINSLWKSEEERSQQDAHVLFSKSEVPFMPYEGKIIRQIYIQRYGFETSFLDTSNRINFIGTKILNVLHTDTREQVIRNNLFIHENTVLNPYKIADNERFLRTIEFIQDARMVIWPVEGSDSVDVVVITKDLFSLTGSLDAVSVNTVRAGIAEANLMGLGQRVDVNGIWKSDRNPPVGYDLRYSVQNIAGSFIRGSIGHSTYSSGISEEEQATYVQLVRPLVSPYSRVAGGLDIRLARSVNVYQKADSLFRTYQYNSYDGWIAYSLHKKQEWKRASAEKDRISYFISFRYRHQDFIKAPEHPAFYNNPAYRRNRTALVSFTFFKQDFYKMNYLYGFGTTEDVPYGYSVSFTGGWHKLEHADRPYLGISASRFLVTPQSGFLQLLLRTGGYIQDGSLTDAGLLLGADWYSKMLFPGRSAMREHIRVSFARLGNRVAATPLRLNNVFGVEALQTDSIYGQNRISFYAETILYTRFKLLGVRFAPFGYVAASLLTPESGGFVKSDLYSGLGGGVRIRNENLIFGTIELRGGFLPRTAWGVRSYDFSIRSNIRFRYRNEFISAPDVADFNAGF